MRKSLVEMFGTGIVHKIVPEDVGNGVYRHPFRSQQRSLLVAISYKFGGIMPCDVGKRVYLDRKGDMALLKKGF